MKKITIPLENKAGAITFIPIANVVFYFTSLFTSKGKKLAVYIETVVLLIIGSLLLRLSLGWVMNAVCAYVLSVVGVIVEQQLLQDAPPAHKKKQLLYIILLSAVFLLLMVTSVPEWRNSQEKMQPICQDMLEAMTQQDQERWQSYLHPTRANKLQDMTAYLAALEEEGIPIRADWQLGSMTGYRLQISDKDHYISTDFYATADGRTYRIRITHLRSYEGSGIVEFAIRAD